MTCRIGASPVVRHGSALLQHRPCHSSAFDRGETPCRGRRRLGRMGCVNPDEVRRAPATSARVSSADFDHDRRDRARARGVSAGSPCTPLQLTDACAALGHDLPETLAHLYGFANGFFDESGQWHVIWPLDRVVEDNLRYRRDALLPSTVIAFGDDGFGAPFCVELGAENGSVGRWSWIDDEIEVDEGDLDGFLGHWAGLSPWVPGGSLSHATSGRGTRLTGADAVDAL